MNEKNNSKKGNEIALPETNISEVLMQNEILMKRLEELEKKQDKQPKSFEEQMQYFEYQQQIITHLKLFNDKKEIINMALNQVKEKTESGDFETELFRLSMGAVKGQQNKSIFEISNPVIIYKVLNGVSCEIDTKIEALKAELTI